MSTQPGWWKFFPFRDRDELGLAFRDLSNLPGVWQSVATETREKDGNHEIGGTYASGLASGLDIAAKQLQRALDSMAEVTPVCPHGKTMLALCTGSECLL